MTWLNFTQQESIFYLPAPRFYRTPAAARQAGAEFDGKRKKRVVVKIIGE